MAFSPVREARVSAIWADRRYLDMSFFVKKHKQTTAAT
jgi:hypothetical protein